MMIRAFNLVWDCPGDATANVTGYLCARCGGSRATLELADRRRNDH